MSNSVFRITEDSLDDSLLLLVGEDGTVTPDKKTVQNFLSNKTGSTHIQIMHINNTDAKNVDVSIDHLTYVPNQDCEEVHQGMDIVARNLHNIKLDHDYTSPNDSLQSNEEYDDDLAKTLSILDGSSEVATTQPKVTVEKVVQKPNKVQNRIIRSLTTPKLVPISNKNKIKIISNQQIRTATLSSAPKPKAIKQKMVIEEEEEEDEEDLEDEDFNAAEAEENDSDFEPETSKPKPAIKKRPIVKTEPIKASPKVAVEPKQPELPKLEPIKSPEPEKKIIKKEKKAPKPIPDDFALFSTPDIIRRVPESPGSPTKPGRISQENRSRSASETSPTAPKQTRLSIDGKTLPKNKDRRPSGELQSAAKRLSIDEKAKKPQVNESLNESVDLPSLPDFTSTSDPQSLNLEGSGLDLDPTLLDNINNDIISDDILYQVAQSLVGNAELQNAIDKGLNEGVLDPTVNLAPSVSLAPNEAAEQNATTTIPSSTDPYHKGTQIVRPDGRVVVIPPIERPATRSRNRKKEEEKPIFKPILKPLDEEHVSGNELDSSNDEEEESEDDPNKLWCICNQPHNNRFMICCDTCEEWYHGKCVNITKAMGQQMESEGREWICLFCKDPALSRPQAAARRIRKASRNSRASTDDNSDSTAVKSEVPCVVCQKTSRKNSIFCSEACILAHASGVERVVVFERASGKMLSGNRAPSAANLEPWLKEHPGYEVVRSAGKIVTSKLTQSKLKLVKNSEGPGVSVALQKKGVNVGVLKHSPKHAPPGRNAMRSFKMAPRPFNAKEPRTKLIQTQLLPNPIKSVSIIGGSAPVKAKVQSPTLKGLRTPPLPPPKDKPVPVKTPKSRQAESAPKQAENIRENVQKTLFEQLTNRLKLADDLKLSEDEVKNISNEIESQLYKCFGDTGQKYRNKYRSLIFNIKDVKNQTLWRRICEKSINPYELVRLSPDDLASQELAMWREREAKHQLDMIKKSELELLNCNRQYVLKTHKGEQVLEDNRPADTVDNNEAIKSLTEGPVEPSGGGKGNSSSDGSKRELSKERDKKTSSKHYKDKDRKKESSRNRSLSKDKERSRRRSRSRDHKHSDRKRSRSRDSRDKHRKSSHKSSRHKNKESHITDKLDKKSKEILEQLEKNKIVAPLEDRLWKHVPQEDVVAPAESDSDHEPTSTVTIPTPPRNAEVDDVTVKSPVTDKKKEKMSSPKERSKSPPPAAKTENNELWRGTINMIDVAQISISAIEVSGDCTGLAPQLPANLDIVGRIHPDTVWDYIGKMKCSNSKGITLLRLKATNVEETMPYLALYSYLNSKTRLAVVKSTNKSVKDFYIYPLASQKPIPQALLPLSGPGFEENRSPLLLAIIVRDKRKRAYADSTSSASSKKSKVDSPTPSTVLPARSHTPPPKASKLPLPPPVKDDQEEPYSPADSDPDTIAPSLLVDPLQTYPSTSSLIPGLDLDLGTVPPDPPTELDFERQMLELNMRIAKQKSEINSISQNIVTASTEIGTKALANIALPSNLQQILDSIKTIGASQEPENMDIESVVEEEVDADLTIPLLFPKSVSKRAANNSSVGDTPIKLPSKSKKVSSAAPSPSREEKKSVLSSLTEEELIRKAAEMLGDTSTKDEPDSKSAKSDLVELPPVPGLD